MLDAVAIPLLVLGGPSANFMYQQDKSPAGPMTPYSASFRAQLLAQNTNPSLFRVLLQLQTPFWGPTMRDLSQSLWRNLQTISLHVLRSMSDIVDHCMTSGLDVEGQYAW